MSLSFQSCTMVRGLPTSSHSSPEGKPASLSPPFLYLRPINPAPMAFPPRTATPVLTALGSPTDLVLGWQCPKLGIVSWRVLICAHQRGVNPSVPHFLALPLFTPHRMLLALVLPAHTAPPACLDTIWDPHVLYPLHENQAIIHECLRTPQAESLLPKGMSSSDKPQ